MITTEDIEEWSGCWVRYYRDEEGREVRVMGCDGESWYFGVDICDLLGIRRGPHTYSLIDPGGSTRLKVNNELLLNVIGLGQILKRVARENWGEWAWLMREVVSRVERGGLIPQTDVRYFQRVPMITVPMEVFAVWMAQNMPEGRRRRVPGKVMIAGKRHFGLSGVDWVRQCKAWRAWQDDQMLELTLRRPPGKRRAGKYIDEARVLNWITANWPPGSSRPKALATRGCHTLNISRPTFAKYLKIWMEKVEKPRARAYFEKRGVRYAEN